MTHLRFISAGAGDRFGSKTSETIVKVYSQERKVLLFDSRSVPETVVNRFRRDKRLETLNFSNQNGRPPANREPDGSYARARSRFSRSRRTSWRIVSSTNSRRRRVPISPAFLRVVARRCTHDDIAVLETSLCKQRYPVVTRVPCVKCINMFDDNRPRAPYTMCVRVMTNVYAQHAKTHDGRKSILQCKPMRRVRFDRKRFRTYIPPLT